MMNDEILRMKEGNPSVCAPKLVVYILDTKNISGESWNLNILSFNVLIINTLIRIFIFLFLQKILVAENAGYH